MGDVVEAKMEIEDSGRERCRWLMMADELFELGPNACGSRECQDLVRNGILFDR